MRLHYNTTILNPSLIYISEVLAREHFLLCAILMIHHYDNLQNKSKLAQTDLQWLNTKYRDVFLNLRNHVISIIQLNLKIIPIDSVRFFIGYSTTHLYLKYN